MPPALLRAARFAHQQLGLQFQGRRIRCRLRGNLHERRLTADKVVQLVEYPRVEQLRLIVFFRRERGICQAAFAEFAGLGEIGISPFEIRAGK